MPLSNEVSEKIHQINFLKFWVKHLLSSLASAIPQGTLLDQLRIFCHLKKQSKTAQTFLKVPSDKIFEDVLLSRYRLTYLLTVSKANYASIFCSSSSLCNLSRLSHLSLLGRM